MMQEDELVIKDGATLNEIDIHTRGGREVQPFTISGMLSNLQNTDYHYSKFEIYVTLVVMLSTISGGFLEGYSSPAIPSLLIDPTSLHLNNMSLSNSTLKVNINQTNVIPESLIPTTQISSFENHKLQVTDNSKQKDMQSQSSKVSITMGSQPPLISPPVDEPVITSEVDDGSLSLTTLSVIVDTKENIDEIKGLEQESSDLEEIFDDSEKKIGDLAQKVGDSEQKMNENVNMEKEIDQIVTTVDSDIITTVTPVTLIDSQDKEKISTTNPSVENINGKKIKRNVNVTPHSSLVSSTNEAVAKSTEIPDLPKKPLKITEEEASWLGSLLLLGACLGAIFSSWIVSLGRRHAILFSALPRLTGWILIASSVSISTLYTGRFLSGFSLGMVSTAAPIYISEVSHPSLRGSLNCIVQLGVNIGIFLAALFGTFMGWQSLAIVGSVLVLVYFVPTIMIPNSPSWLVCTGKELEAREVLKKLRGSAFSIEEELQQLLTIAEKNKKLNGIAWADLFLERRCRMPLIVVVLLTLVNRLSGYNAIITYCVTFLHDAVPYVSEYGAATAICFVQIIATGFSITVVDKWGRRKLLLLSVCLMAISLLIIAFCKGVFSTNESAAWITVLATMSFVGSYSLGVGPLTWVLLGELFPMDARDKASALVSVLNWLMAFLITKVYFNMEATLGVGGTCLIYASVCIMGAICFYFLVPETKGRTLAEIEAHFTYSQLSWRNLAPKVDRAMSSILDQDLTATIDTYSTFQ